MKPTNTIGWIARVLCALTCLYYLLFNLGGTGLFDSSFILTPHDLLIEALLLLAVFFLLLGFRFELAGGAGALAVALGFFAVYAFDGRESAAALNAYENDFTLIIVQGFLFLLSGIDMIRTKLRSRK